jgi:hypothetical protein
VVETVTEDPVDESLRARFEALQKRITDTLSGVSGRLEDEVHNMHELRAVHRTVADAAKEYAALLAQVPERERAVCERSYGRRLLDLKRLAAQLPQQIAGQATARAADATSEGSPFLLRRDPPKSIQPDRMPVPGQPAFRVGTDIDAWCGTCGETTAHAILAVVELQPKQVMCRLCNARHNYRTEPPKKRAPQVTKPPRMTSEQIEAQKRERNRFDLIKELTAAENVRPFVPREHYRAGEIIQHPEYGRGKVDAVVRGAIVVKFRDGVRSLSLF